MKGYSFPIELAEQRDRSGVTLEQIAASTKISMRFLRAIEQGDFEKLPGGVYTINYLRQYSRAIHCDEEQTLELYRASAKAETPEPPDKPDRLSRLRAWLRGWAAQAAPKLWHGHQA